jgi:hypothetical protein
MPLMAAGCPRACSPTSTPSASHACASIPSPALALLEQHYPGHEYYAACRRRHARALPEARRNMVLVRRRGATVVREELERPRGELLRALLARDIASALQRAADSGMATAGVHGHPALSRARLFADLRPG